MVDLKYFYYRTKLGRIVQRALRTQLQQLWGDTKGQTIAGFGFAAPLLRPFIEKSRRVICLMPGQQGVMPWPSDLPNHSVLIEETSWPIATGTLDRLVVLHGLETCDNTSDLLDEIWRVLGPGGKVLFIVPNRSGLWARSDKTPFGFGRPYNTLQLENQLRKHQFIPERHFSALYFVPSEHPFWLGLAKITEKLGIRRIMPLVSGVVMVEASKQVYAKPKSGFREKLRKPIGAFEGMIKPVKEPRVNKNH